MEHDIVDPLVHKVWWGITSPVCIEDNSVGLFCKLLVFWPWDVTLLLFLYFKVTVRVMVMYTDSTTRSLQNCISFMLIKDELLMAQVKGVYIVVTVGLGWVPPPPHFFIFNTSNMYVLYRRYACLFIHFPHIPQKWSSYMTSGCCFTLKDSVDTSSVCCYLAVSNCLVGVKSYWWNCWK